MFSMSHELDSLAVSEVFLLPK